MVALVATWAVLSLVGSGSAVKAPPWPPASSLSKAPKVTVLQVGQASYIARFAAHIATARGFASSQGYSYKLVTLSDGTATKGRAATNDACVYTSKVRAIHTTLAGLAHEGDWLLFLDLDVAYATCDHTRFTSLMPLNDGAHGECHLIAQDSSHTVNTGVLALQRSPVGMSLMSAWLREQERLGTCEGAADQLALQSSVLSLKIPGYANECDPNYAAAAQEAKDGIPRPLHIANLCYKRVLAAVGLLEGHRSGHGLCLLDRLTHRLNMHDGRQKYKPGDVFWHDKHADLESLHCAPSVSNQTTERSLHQSVSEAPLSSTLSVAELQQQRREKRRQQRLAAAANAGRVADTSNKEITSKVVAESLVAGGGIAAGALKSLHVPPSRYSLKEWSSSSSSSRDKEQPPPAPACRVNEATSTYETFRPPPSATPKTWEVAKAIAVLPATGDCYARSDYFTRPASATYWETGSATRLNSGACCCAYWDTSGQGGPKVNNASKLLQLTSGDSSASPSSAEPPPKLSPFCVASFPAVAKPSLSSPSASKRALAIAGGADSPPLPPVRVVVCLSGMVRSAPELECALNSMQATPGFLTRPGGVAVVMHASVPSSSLSAVQSLLDTAPVSKLVRQYELETTDPKTLALVQRAMRQCGNGALDRFVQELKRRHRNVLFDLGVDHSFAYMARHLWLAHRLARQLEAAQIVKLGPSRGQLHFIVRARVDHHFELPAPPALAPGKPKPTNINNDWWAAVAHEDVLSSTTSSAVGDGPFRHSNLLLVGAAAPLYDKRANGVPLNLRCGVDDQFAMGSPHVMDAYASLFPDLNDDFVKLLLLHRNDANGHTNERMMATHLRYRSVTFAEAKVGARIHECSWKNNIDAPNQAPAQHDVSAGVDKDAFYAAQRKRQEDQPPWHFNDNNGQGTTATSNNTPPKTGAAKTTTTAATVAPSLPLRRHNATLVLSSQRCGSNWISRMVRTLGVRPYGQEAMLDFCTNARSNPRRPLYGVPLDRCMLQDGNCRQCNKDKPPGGGSFSEKQRRAYCSVPHYQSCIDPLLGHKSEEQGRGKFGFLIKYDHFNYAPKGAMLDYFKTRGIGIIHITRDPLFVYLSLLDGSYKNQHGGSYSKHKVDLNAFRQYHMQYMAWATEWAQLMSQKDLPVLDLTYEELSGRSSWASWNRFAAFLGAPPLAQDPNAKEAGTFSTPLCKDRILNWGEVEASAMVQGTRTQLLCADPFDPSAAKADYLKPNKAVTTAANKRGDSNARSKAVVDTSTMPSPPQTAAAHSQIPARSHRNRNKNSGGGGAGNENPLLKVGLVTRSFSGRRTNILKVLPCWEATLIGGGTSELVYVLDEESEADHELGDEILAFFKKAGLEASVRVEYEPRPPCADVMFPGKLEGNAGKDRSQRSNFIADAYTNAEIIAMFDAEICFVAPVTPAYYAKASNGDREEERLQMMATAGVPEGDHWGVDGWALKLPTPLDVMWTNSFPFFFWRSDIVAARNHLTSGHLMKIPPPPTTCVYANAFDRAFAAITNAAPVWGYRHRRKGYSQFNLLTNFVLHHHPSGYAFHLIKTKPSDMASLQEKHPQAKFLAADAATLGGANNVIKKKSSTTSKKGRSSAEEESVQSGGFVVPAMNAEDVQGVVPIMRRVCCAVHPSLRNRQGCQALETLDANLNELASEESDNRYGKGKMPSSASAGRAKKDLEAAKEELAAMDKTFGNAGRCYGQPAGDKCAQTYEKVTQQYVAAAPAAERIRAEKACAQIVEQFASESIPQLPAGSNLTPTPKQGQRLVLATAKDSKSKEVSGSSSAEPKKDAIREQQPTEAVVDDVAPAVESKEIDEAAGKNELPAAVAGILAGAVVLGHRASAVLKRNSGKAS